MAWCAGRERCREPAKTRSTRCWRAPACGAARAPRARHLPTAARHVPSGHEALDALLPRGGWPQCGLIELLLDEHGIGELQIVMPLLRRANPDPAVAGEGRWIAWLAPPFLPYAPALMQCGVRARTAIDRADPRRRKRCGGRWSRCCVREPVRQCSGGQARRRPCAAAREARSGAGRLGGTPVSGPHGIARRLRPRTCGRSCGASTRISRSSFSNHRAAARAARG